MPRPQHRVWQRPFRIREGRCRAAQQLRFRVTVRRPERYVGDLADYRRLYSSRISDFPGGVVTAAARPALESDRLLDDRATASTMPEGRIRNASFTSRRSGVPALSRLGWRVCMETPSGNGTRSSKLQGLQLPHPYCGWHCCANGRSYGVRAPRLTRPGYPPTCSDGTTTSARTAAGKRAPHRHG